MKFIALAIVALLTGFSAPYAIDAASQETPIPRPRPQQQAPQTPPVGGFHVHNTPIACGARPDMVRFIETFGEAPIVRMSAGTNGETMLELYHNPDKGTWTILRVGKADNPAITTPMEACHIASGKALIQVDFKKPIPGRDG